MSRQRISALANLENDVKCTRRSQALVKLGRRRTCEAFWTRLTDLLGCQFGNQLEVPCTVEKGLETAWTTCKDFCVDGSGGQHTSNVELRRCGWAAVAMHDRTNNLGAFLVVLRPGAKQMVPRAELVVVNCTVEKMEGRKVRQRSKNRGSSSNADLWKRYRRALVRVRCKIDFVKVPAHTEIQDVWPEHISLRSWCGRFFADKAAGKAAQKGGVPDDQVCVYKGTINRAARILGRATELSPEEWLPRAPGTLRPREEEKREHVDADGGGASGWW